MIFYRLFYIDCSQTLVKCSLLTCMNTYEIGWLCQRLIYRYYWLDSVRRTRKKKERKFVNSLEICSNTWIKQRTSLWIQILIIKDNNV